MYAVFSPALVEGLFFAVIGMGEVIDARQKGAEHLAVADDTAHRSTAEADAVIAALAADQPGAGALALDLMIGQRDLERGVGGLRSGIAEENVIAPGGREIGYSARRLTRPAECRTETAVHNPGSRPAWRSPRKSGCGHGRHWCTTCPTRHR